MAHHQIIRWAILFLALLSLTACQRALLKAQIETYKWTYKPGEHLVATYEETRKQYSCKNTTSVYLKETFFRPYKMVPGEQILTRFVYASCTPEDLRGTILRQVIHNGRVVLRDTTPHHFVPGTWGVNAYIQIPPDASPGAYIFSVTITAGAQVFKEIHSFQVMQP
ncbi:hypothetical protein [Desulfococcus sp.]|uniref:hypothetical protein n=1 Tax=Desulfococcus sp. TaxID=2025834 RepID=UPI003D0CCC2A